MAPSRDIEWPSDLHILVPVVRGFEDGHGACDMAVVADDERCEDGIQRTRIRPRDGAGGPKGLCHPLSSAPDGRVVLRNRLSRDTRPLSSGAVELKPSSVFRVGTSLVLRGMTMWDRVPEQMAEVRRRCTRKSDALWPACCRRSPWWPDDLVAVDDPGLRLRVEPVWSSSPHEKT